MKIKREPTRLEKKARRGDRGYPVATVAYYGPDASRASKVAVGIIEAEGVEARMQRWFSDTEDVRRNPAIDAAILQFIASNNAMTVAMSAGVIGCPHEEGIDYPDGQACPQCPYWFTRDRWTGEQLPEQ